LSRQLTYNFRPNCKAKN